MEWIFVGVGGFFGSIGRHGVNVLFRDWIQFPWATFAVNSVGCFFAGLGIGILNAVGYQIVR